jgi:hypothetical protein
MTAMSKSPKKKTPKIDPRLLARPRLDALFARHTSEALDDARLQVELSALMAEAGQPALLEALLKRLETTPAAERESLPRWAAPFKQPEPIAYLWQRAKASKTTPVARRIALELLQALGEDADPAQVEQYAPLPAKPKPVKGWPIDLSTPEPKPRTPEQEAAEACWKEFEGADLPGKLALLETSLASLDAGDAFEMVAQMRDELQPGQSAEARTQFAALVEKVRAARPAQYAAHRSYYVECLLIDAATEGRWEAMRPLLIEMAADEDLDADAFFQVIELLLYHGQMSLLLDVLPSVHGRMDNPEKVLPGTVAELDDIVMLLTLFNYVSATPQPRADDPALLSALAPYSGYPTEWLERILPHFATSTGWTPANFGEAVDAEQWEINLSLLLTEFMAEQHRQGVPLSKAELAQSRWADMLHKQISGNIAQPRPAKKKAKAGPRAPTVTSPLVPQAKLLDPLCAELLNFINPQPHSAGATIELLPAYLHFIARQGLLARPELEAALKNLKPLAGRVSSLLLKMSDDGRLTAAVAAAWAEEHLAEVVHDPAVPDTVAAPPPPPPQPQAQPGAHLTYLFRVIYRFAPDVWRTVELLESQTLRDLHRIIQAAFAFDDDHLYSFYLSGQAWDRDTEYAAQPERGARGVSVPISSLHLRPKQKFLYLFDYGDQHEFDVQLAGLDPTASKEEHYPRIVEAHGEAPAQYGRYDDEEDKDYAEDTEEGKDWDDEDEDNDWEDDDELPSLGNSEA